MTRIYAPISLDESRKSAHILAMAELPIATYSHTYEAKAFEDELFTLFELIRLYGQDAEILGAHAPLQQTAKGYKDAIALAISDPNELSRIINDVCAKGDPRFDAAERAWMNCIQLDADTRKHYLLGVYHELG